MSVVGGSALHNSSVSAIPRLWWASSAWRQRICAFQAYAIDGKQRRNSIGTRLNCLQALTLYLQKTCILPLLHSLLDELQGLLQILPVNSILDLIVAAEKHRVIDRYHGEELPVSPIGS